jgi:hypothetical protein
MPLPKQGQQEQKRNNIPGDPSPLEPDIPQTAAPNLQADVDRLEAATDQAIAACGGKVSVVPPSPGAAMERFDTTWRGFRRNVGP